MTIVLYSKFQNSSDYTDLDMVRCCRRRQWWHVHPVLVPTAVMKGSSVYRMVPLSMCLIAMPLCSKICNSTERCPKYFSLEQIFLVFLRN